MTSEAPRGGLARCSNRVMNMAHVLRQNARRFPDLPGLIWGEKSWTWIEFEREVNSLAAALADRGIAKGDALIVVEAMKMEHTLRSPRDGVVESVFVTAGEQVIDGSVLLALVPEEKA